MRDRLFINVGYRDSLLKECDEKNITVISFFDSAYPNNLRQIEDPPMVLFTRGLPLPDFDSKPSITMVGTRDAKKEYLKYAAINAFSLAAANETPFSSSDFNSFFISSE